MPIYGFECTVCGHRFERLQKLSDADPSTCPSCNTEHIRRQISAPSFRLSGSGWYETDFKKESDKKRNLVESSDSSSATSSAATTTPTAPAAPISAPSSSSESG